MGRRKKRRKLIRKRVKRIPIIFVCPHCSRQSVKITVKKMPGQDIAIAEAVCGECGLCARYTVPSLAQPVDAYGKLVDLYESYEGDIEELIKKGECLTDFGGQEGV